MRRILGVSHSASLRWKGGGEGILPDPLSSSRSPGSSVASGREFIRGLRFAFAPKMFHVCCQLQLAGTLICLQALERRLELKLCRSIKRPGLSCRASARRAQTWYPRTDSRNRRSSILHGSISYRGQHGILNDGSVPSTCSNAEEHLLSQLQQLSFQIRKVPAGPG